LEEEELLLVLLLSLSKLSSLQLLLLLHLLSGWCKLDDCNATVPRALRRLEVEYEVLDVEMEELACLMSTSATGSTSWGPGGQTHAI